MEKQIQALRVLQEVSEALFSEERKVGGLLARFAAMAEIIDYAGYAKVNHDRLKIEDAVGAGAQRLAGLSFGIGEGLLGLVASSGVPGLWEELYIDPRSAFLLDAGVSPAKLACVPVIEDDNVVGVVFGGSERSDARTELLSEWALAASALLAGHLVHTKLQRVRTSQKLKMATLSEIAASLASIDDARRVLSMMLDTSISMMQGGFALIAARLEEGSVHTVSRGIASELAEVYMQDGFKRWARRTESGAGSSLRPQLGQQDGLNEALECPLFARGELIGFLAVGLPNRSKFEEHRDYVSGLVHLGVSSLLRIKEQQQFRVARGLPMLMRSLRHLDPVLHKRAYEARELAAGFAAWLGLRPAAVQRIGDACALSCFPEDLLGELQAESPEWRELVVFVRRAESAGSDHPDRESCILALAGGAASNPKGYFADEFQRYLESRHSLSRDYELDSGMAEMNPLTQQQPESESKSDTPSSTPNHLDARLARLKQLYPLSGREREVLDHIVRGRSNREIAEKLFISEHTVKNHITNLFHKMSISDRTHLFAQLYQMGDPPAT